MGRRLNQYLGSLGDDGPARVVFVFDDEDAPAGAEVVFRLNLRGAAATGPAVPGPRGLAGGGHEGSVASR